jgi:hypothetical protein
MSFGGKRRFGKRPAMAPLAEEQHSLEGRLAGRQIGWKAGRLESRSAGKQVGWKAGRLESRSAGKQVGWKAGRLESRSAGRQVGWRLRSSGEQGTQDWARKSAGEPPVTS